MLLLLLACTDPAAGKVHSADPGTGATTPDTDPTPTDVPTAQVAHTRELRGFWVASVWNLDFPSEQGLSVAEAEAELDTLVEAVSAAHGNAIFFQVRPEGDALYASELEPWSRYLTGTQGRDPGYDPLQALLDRAHPQGIEVHAWLNPYRAKADDGSSAVSPHVTVDDPDNVVPYDGMIWMDPGAASILERTTAVVSDLCARYPIDGIHFDDYFYPYPDGTDFPDDESWEAYERGGGALARDDWRRDNVNRLVEAVSLAVAEQREDVRFGIAPFGIYRPGTPAGVSGLDQYAELYSDPVAWTEAGWLDYLSPQLYWTHDSSGQPFGTLIDWWANLPQDGQYTFPGLYLSKLGESGWDLDEFDTQLALTRAEAGSGALGQIHYAIDPIVENRDGVTDRMATDWYATPAASPVLVSAAAATLTPPTVQSTAEGVELSHPDPLRYWAVYAAEGDGWTIDRLVPADVDSVALGSGRWAVAAIDRRGVESRGVIVER